MKKLIFVAAFTACAFGMNAQLTVLKSGNLDVSSDAVIISNGFSIELGGTLYIH